MTTVSVPTASQQAAAEMLVADPGRWSPGRSRATGSAFWLVKGSQDRSYFTTSDGCSCPGFRHRGICSHVAACRIRERQERPVRVVGAIDAETREQAVARLRAELGMADA